MHSAYDVYRLLRYYFCCCCATTSAPDGLRKYARCTDIVYLQNSRQLCTPTFSILQKPR
ncbi:hypothetical protein BS78_03G071900 [Paspalum vaginatum]|nr:hypothetical protein BS78_03G071900 [Paspalum vaginatum]